MWPADPAQAPERRAVAVRGHRNAVHARQGATSRRSSRAGSTRSTRPAAGRCSSSSPAACASACRRGSPRPPRLRSATRTPNEIEMLWPGLAPPYAELFAWLEGRADKPVTRDPAPFRPAMLAHAIEDTDFAALDPARLHGRMEMGRHPRAGGRRRGRGRPASSTRLYSRTGEDISKSFPDLAEALRLPGAIDGELLIVRDGRVQSFNVLQQRLNRKAVTPKLLQRISRASARLRPAGRRRRRPARRFLSPSAARGCEAFVDTARRSARRSLAAGAVRHLGRR